MTKQYVDLLNTVHIDIWEDDKTWAKKETWTDSGNENIINCIMYSGYYFYAVTKGCIFARHSSGNSIKGM